jgi:hypothetical protein
MVVAGRAAPRDEAIVRNSSILGLDKSFPQWYNMHEFEYSLSSECKGILARAPSERA